jgi:hypothetical protein
MFCINCGIKIVSNGKFCQACGKSTEGLATPFGESAETLEHEIEEPREKIVMPRPTFNGIRKMNWVIASLLAAGLFLMLFKAPSVIGLMLIILFGGIFVGSPVVSATALGDQDFSMFGIYIAIDATRRKKLQQTSRVLNWILGGFGIIGLIACIATQQYGAMISMFVYVLPPYLNIKALRELKQFERDFA